MKLSNDLLGGVRDRNSRDSWTSRTARIEAAHTIIVTAAFFSEARSLSLPFKWSDLRITKEEQHALRTDLTSPVHPSPELPFEKVCENLLTHYRMLSDALRKFVRGLRVWDKLSEHKRSQASREFVETLPSRAIERYKDFYRQLMVDVPEFAYWAGMISDEASRTELASLRALLSKLAKGTVSSEQLDSLARVQAACLQRPIAKTGDIPVGMRLPTLEEAYVTPRFRTARASEEADNATRGEDTFWEDRDVREDLPSFIAGFLSTSDAAENPLIVLGHPGAGKSVLTQILSAYLPASYMPIRVPLREVSASRDLQVQIEQAIYNATGDRLQWPSLARSCERALPVVMLDGFDELLQATGAHQSAYLERIVDFQERERNAGRSVAFIVTTRSAVIERARVPEKSILVRLEPFNDRQIDRWIGIWNHSNASYFDHSSLKPFSAELVKAHIHLAEQPLLLMMLALYDADNNVLRLTIHELRESELYERLLKAFAIRELQKHHPDEHVKRLVEDELLILSIAAFAMFNRGRQWVTADEVSKDLTVFLPVNQRQPSDLDLPLSRGELAFGRFFFVHRSQAHHDEVTLHTYEFLHATFGEFLIARLIASILRDMVAQMTGVFSSDINDTWLSALLSWSTISVRTPILSFLQEMLASLTCEERNNRLHLIYSIFHGLRSRHSLGHPAYLPRVANPPVLYAQYSANLLCVGLVCTPSIKASQLFPDPEETVIEDWLKLVRLWQAGCDSEEMSSLATAIQVSPQRDSDGVRDLQLSYAPHGWDPSPVDLRWMLDLPSRSTSVVMLNKSWADASVREMAFSLALMENIFLHIMEPMLAKGWKLLEAFRISGDQSHLDMNSSVRDLLWLLVENASSAEERAKVYLRLLSIPRLQDMEVAVFNALSTDMNALNDEQAGQVVSAIKALNPHEDVMALVRNLALERGVMDLDGDT
ncbi:hypothetical protein [Nonomuraea sp. NPDC049784]|uniref:NACHT domain-containing protein n=1 Tax=Nonomuraea sp. NPDC049784 TaxID=3154361 RepID=UPI0033E738B9